MRKFKKLIVNMQCMQEGNLVTKTNIIIKVPICIHGKLIYLKRRIHCIHWLWNFLNLAIKKLELLHLMSLEKVIRVYNTSKAEGFPKNYCSLVYEQSYYSNFHLKLNRYLEWTQFRFDLPLGMHNWKMDSESLIFMLQTNRGCWFNELSSDLKSSHFT